MTFRALNWSAAALERNTHITAVVILLLSLLFGSGLRSAFINVLPFYGFYYLLKWGLPWQLENSLKRSNSSRQGRKFVWAQSLGWALSLVALIFVIYGLYTSLIYLRFYTMLYLFQGLGIFFGAQQAIKKISALKTGK